MIAKRRLGTVITVAGLLMRRCRRSLRARGVTPHVPLQKVIGQAKPDIVPSLIVMNARGASLQGGKLTLTGVSPNAIIFADRPVRAAGHALTTHLLEEWAPGQRR